MSWIYGRVIPCYVIQKNWDFLFGPHQHSCKSKEERSESSELNKIGISEIGFAFPKLQTF